MKAARYVDTSAALRAVLEDGTTPAIASQIENAEILVTSRLSLVESERALLRMRRTSSVTEELLADAARAMDELWSHCTIWELTEEVCRAAMQVAPSQPLRTLDALHLATYVLARRRIAGLELLTADHRLERAARAV